MMHTHTADLAHVYHSLAFAVLMSLDHVMLASTTYTA